MGNSTIGIKVADGTYRPIIEGESLKKKKLILTTVYDDQGSVQIDLYRGSGQELDDAKYVGSLLIEDILPGVKGEPEIELIVGVDEDGTLTAVAGDVGSGEKQSLSVSLDSLDEDGFDSPNFELDDTVFDDVPDFGDISDSDEEPEFGDFPDLEESPLSDASVFDEEPAAADEAIFDDVPSLDDEPGFEEVPVIDDESGFDGFGEMPGFEDDSAADEVPDFGDGMSLDEEPVFSENPDDFNDLPSFSGESEIQDSFEDEVFPPAGSESLYEEEEEPLLNKKSRNPLAVAVIIIIILILLGLGAFLFLRGSKQDSVPPLVAENSLALENDSPAEPAVESEVEPEVEKPAEVEATPAAKIIDSTTVPPEGRGGGVWYRLKWGDTLWNLSKSFYRTPWLYGLIVVENNIKNPDVIYAGTDLFIPEN